MFRMLWQTAVAAWICAALFVSPIVAALECRRCCSSMDAVGVTATCTTNEESRAAVPACCHQDSSSSTPLGSQSSSCPSCPKCEAKRPNPAVSSSDSIWKLPVPAAILVPFLTVDDLGGSPMFAEGTREVVDRAKPPPPRVLFCTWRE